MGLSGLGPDDGPHLKCKYWENETEVSIYLSANIEAPLHQVSSGWDERARGIYQHMNVPLIHPT